MYQFGHETVCQLLYDNQRHVPSRWYVVILDFQHHGLNWVFTKNYRSSYSVTKTCLVRCLSLNLAPLNLRLHHPIFIFLLSLRNLINKYLHSIQSFEQADSYNGHGYGGQVDLATLLYLLKTYSCHIQVVKVQIWPFLYKSFSFLHLGQSFILDSRVICSILIEFS